MFKKNKGFTLAELLIVLAIIAVLVAISIPIFTSQLEKARRAVDISNARNIRSVLSNAVNDGTIVFNNKNATLFVYVGKGGTDGGSFDEDKNLSITDGITIGGIHYRNNGDGKTHGQQLTWNFLTSNGIPSGLRMKQKNPSLTWYGVSINAKGESYYYEGDGNKAGKNTKAKYDWSDLNTPVK